MKRKVAYSIIAPAMFLLAVSISVYSQSKIVTDSRLE